MASGPLLCAAGSTCDANRAWPSTRCFALIRIRRGCGCLRLNPDRAVAPIGWPGVLAMDSGQTAVSEFKVWVLPQSECAGKLGELVLRARGLRVGESILYSLGEGEIAP
jgi:hypothetical protein